MHSAFRSIGCGLLVWNFLWAAVSFALDPSSQIKSVAVYSTFAECKNKGHRSTWCTYNYFQDKKKTEQFLNKILPEKDSLDFDDFFIASFSIGDRSFSEFICERYLHKQEITLVIDAGAVESELEEKLAKACPGKSGIAKNILKLGGGGKASEWNIQHVKFWTFKNKKTGMYTLIFGTGNATSGSFTHTFNSWISLVTSANTGIFKQHACLKGSLIAAAKVFTEGKSKELSKSAFVDEMRRCRKENNIGTFEQSLREEGIAAMFPPMPEDAVDKRIVRVVDDLKAGQELLGASQYFTSRDLGSALTRAVKRGVKVRIVLEDDNLHDESPYMNSSKRSAEFYKRSLKQSGADFRFVETNEKIHQVMHQKFLIAGGLIITGSGQFSFAAQTSNYENFYFINNEKIIREYKLIFEKLWKAGYKDPS